MEFLGIFKNHVSSFKLIFRQQIHNFHVADAFRQVVFLFLPLTLWIMAVLWKQYIYINL
jgi:hypothetical protein